MVTLLLGGARSGKSARALALAQKTGAPVVFLATARQDPADPEWGERIARHQRERPSEWRTVEVPYALPDAVREHANPESCVIADCLSVWLANLLLENQAVDYAGQALCTALLEARGQVLLVSNEVGLGVVPEHPLGRRFRDALGRLNQDVAATADRVEWLVAGIPTPLKGGPH